jgi:hypothetical protein
MIVFMMRRKLLMVSEKILVEVFGGTASSCSSCAGCGPDSGCGPKQSPEESATELAKELTESHGEKVEVKFIDTDSVGFDNYPKVLQLLRMGYSFPFVFVKEEPRMAGGVDIPKIKSMLDEPVAQA